MKRITSILLIALFFYSCSTDTTDIVETSEVEGLTMVQTFENEFHTVELYTHSGQLEEGYNDIFLRIRGKEGQSSYEAAEIEWRPLMQMQHSSHSAPRSLLSKKPATGSLFNGFIVFPMAQNEMEFWTLSLEYKINGQSYSTHETIDVLPSPRRRVAVFLGQDQQRYVLAMVAPTVPEMATNETKMALFRMDGMEFPVVDNYRIKMEPRMPGMGNHGSPNNTPLVQEQEGGYYSGKMNLTMTGLWRINLQVLNEEGEVVKGEPVTETNESSSLFLELEF